MSVDETNRVRNAGLLPAALQVQRIDMAGPVDRRPHVVRHGALSTPTPLSVVGSMPTGGDGPDDVAVLRVGTAESSSGGTGAPSKVGSWLRAQEWSDVRQVDVIGATARGLSGAGCD